MRQALHAQTRLLDTLIHHLATGEPTARDDQKEVVSVVLFMVQALGISLHSILRLTSQVDMSIRDCFGIARSANELAVNISYIVATGAASAARASRHAMQKRYRDLNRSGSFGGTKWRVGRSDVPPPDVIPGMLEALAEFTNAKGGEVRDWTPLNLDKRIEAAASVSQDAGLCLAGSTAAIYRHSSELLHGTYFSVLFFWTDEHGRPAGSREAFTGIWINHFTSVFTAAFLGAAAVVTICSGVLKMPSLQGEQDELRRKVTRLVEAWTATTDDPDVAKS